MYISVFSACVVFIRWTRGVYRRIRRAYRSTPRVYNCFSRLERTFFSCSRSGRELKVCIQWRDDEKCEKIVGLDSKDRAANLGLQNLRIFVATTPKKPLVDQKDLQSRRTSDTHHTRLPTDLHSEHWHMRRGAAMFSVSPRVADISQVHKRTPLGDLASGDTLKT